MIRVIQGYRVSQGAIIQEGVYDESDPRLYDKAQYLLDNRFAVLFEGEAPTANELAQDSNPGTLIHSVGVTMIHVFHGYRVGEGKMIGAGVYDINDPALFERGQFLLDNRHAEPFESTFVAEPEPEPKNIALPPLSRMKVDELKALAADRGIEIPADAVKADIIALLEPANEE